MFNDSADQYPLGGDLDMSIFDNAIVGQKSIPLGVIGKYHPFVFDDGCKRLLGQLIGLHIANGIHIDGKIRIPGAHKF